MKIASLQDRMHCVDDETNRTLLSSDSSVRALSNELRLLKSSLEQMAERERRVSHRLLSYGQDSQGTLRSLVNRLPCADCSNARSRRENTVHT